uniref:Mannosidase, beta A, lysosomal n=1 Tax=Eptatretus burgeri TaxID=7764 RepID=A0A8C4QQX0_EPTBU
HSRTLRTPCILHTHPFGVVPGVSLMVRDPHFRFNDLYYRWIAYENWTFYRNFSFSGDLRHQQKVVLVFDSIDTVAKVSLNGRTVGHTNNMFITYVSTWPILTQTSFGWDWAPAFATQGVRLGVRLETFSAAALEQLSITTHLGWTLHFLFCFVTFISASEKKQSLKNNPFLLSFPCLFFVVYTVELWWPQGEGDRPGYDVTVIFKLDQGSIIQRNVKVYFRTVELVQQTVQGSPGLSFYLRINGRPVFLRGANWVPADSFLERVTRPRLQNLLQSVVDANMNALRVFGGGIYEQSIFYSLCDELGIMVIQDFMFACALYPAEPTFLESVRNEISQQVLRLSSHPSIVMWVSNNENEVALAKNWFDIPLHLAPHYRSDYISLYIATLRNVILQEDKSRPFLPSSPTNGVESKREGWIAQNPYDTHYGDVHYYNYTADCWDWQTFPCARFLSEFGYQSWPSFSSVAEVSLPEDWQLNSSFCNIRQHQTDGNKYILHQIHRNYPIPVTQNPLRSFQLILYLSQVSQAQCVKMQVEFYRRSRNEVKNGEGWTMGALYWQLNDVWQAPSWSSLGKKMCCFLSCLFVHRLLDLLHMLTGKVHTVCFLKNLMSSGLSVYLSVCLSVRLPTIFIFLSPPRRFGRLSSNLTQ